MEAVFFRNQLFLGQLAKWEASRILTVGERWAGMESDLLVVDPAAPSAALASTGSPVSLRS
jgi:hypothetical protein